jgi:competence protein ComEC
VRSLKLFLLFGLIPFWTRADTPTLALHMVDVGYGSCLVLQSQGTGVKPWAAMLDSGRASAQKTVRTELRRLGIARVDAAFLTHPHPDHVGGYTVWRSPPIDTFYWSGDTADQPDMNVALGRLKRQGVHIQEARIGLRLSAPGGVSVEVLNPTSLAGSIHENELLLLVRFGKTAMLLTGDLDPKVQGRLMQDVLARAQAENLTLCFANWPHHGDQIDTEWEKGLANFTWVGVSVGANDYGLPRVDAYPALASRLLRTDRLGTISIVSDGQNCRYEARGQKSR